jgi:hypothetical protein
MIHRELKEAANSVLGPYHKRRKEWSDEEYKGAIQNRNKVCHLYLNMLTRGTKQELERLHKLVRNTCWKKRRRYVMDKITRRRKGFEHGN